MGSRSRPGWHPSGCCSSSRPRPQPSLFSSETSMGLRGLWEASQLPPRREKLGSSSSPTLSSPNLSSPNLSNQPKLSQFNQQSKDASRGQLSTRECQQVPILALLPLSSDR